MGTLTATIPVPKIDLAAGHGAFPVRTCSATLPVPKFARRGKTVFLLLCGGGKGTQERGIRVAQRLAKEIDDEDHEV